MHIAIEGCAHGELEAIYQCITQLESENNVKIELLICCGDFQSVRNENDLRCMAVPPKYYNMCTFHKYYSGELKAPVLTIFIGGNHEASNYLQELPFGGWVAPNIYYLGYAGVINYKGLRIGGLSGIYKGHDYNKGHFEKSPYNEQNKRSVYHIRNIEVFRLQQLSDSKPLDIFLSHDWPTEVTKFGNEEQLLRFKPYFQNDIENGSLGSPPCNKLLFHLKPKFWFAAHLHCKFAALIPHDDGSTTKFLALDKCLPRKRFLQVLEFPDAENAENSQNHEISYDLEWLTILCSTQHLFTISSNTQYMPSKLGAEKWDFKPTDEDKGETLKKFNGDLKIPQNFIQNAPIFKENLNSSSKSQNVYQPNAQINDQTTVFCKKLLISDPNEERVNSGDISFDNSFNESSDFNDSCFDTSQSTNNDSSLQRSRLVLPDAVNKCEEVSVNAEEIKLDLDNDADTDVIVESVTENDLSDDGLKKVQSSDGKISNESDVKSPPEAKIMKRRNADIYTQE